MNTVRKLSFGCALAALAYASAVAAQTEIAADIDAGRSQGTTVSTSGSVTTIDGGTRVGPNLFHSFRSFSLAAGDTARWTTMDALAIRAVINRITGGDVSFINGEIDAMGIPNADFFFINPAGIVFGSQAVVNVPAAAYFSTAGYLQFEDGVRYMAVTPAGSSLTMAAPSAFGFVGQQGDISVTGLRGSDLGAGVSSLTLAGANVTVANSDITVGELGLFAVGTGESALIPLSGIMPSTRLGGRLFLDDSSIIVRATSSQVRDVRLAAGEIEQLGGSLLTDTAGGYRAGNLWIDADTITVRGAMGSETENDRRAGNIFLTGGDLSILQGGSLASETRLSGDAGNIRANLTGDILLAQGGQIATTTSGTGDAGNVILTSGGALTVTDGSVISASTSGAGAGGNVRIDVAGAMSVTDRSHVSSSSLASDSGQAGEVRITAGSLEVSDRSDILSTTVSSQSAGLVDIDVAGHVSVADFSTIASRTDGEGDAGAVMLSAGSLDIRRGSQVTSNTAGGGDAGAVWVDVDGALVIGSGGKITARAERGVTDGSAGDIFITAGSLVMEDREANTTFQGAEIASTLEGAGQGGSITIDIADHAYIGQGTFISLASTFRAIDGDAGDLFMRAGSMTINGGSIRSITRSFGNAGTLLIDVAGDLHLTGGGEITTSSLETYSGEAGRIGITAGNIYMDSASTITSSTASGQNAGEVVIVSAGDIFLDGDDTKISSSTTAGGNAGMVSVTSGGDLRMSKGALITASTSSTGSAGVIEMAIGGDLEMGFRANIETTTTGDGDAGAVLVAVAGDASIHDTSRIKSTTTGEGDAGEVRFSARSLDIRDASEITSNTQGGGNAGSVYVDIEDALVIGSGGKITARAARGATDGSAGDIFITAGSLIMEDHDPNSIRQGAEIASTLEGGGKGGSITIDVADHAYIGQGTFISLASTFRAIDGDGGDLFMRAGSMTINGGSIRSITRSFGNAGTLLIDVAGDLHLTGGGEITTSSIESDSGQAGRIGITAGNLFMDSGSTISSTTASGQSAGEIDIFSAGNILLDGTGTEISSSTSSAGEAGTVSIASLGDLRVTGGALITASTTGPGSAGLVEIDVGGDLEVAFGGKIATTTTGDGDAGAIDIAVAGAASIHDLGRIESITTGEGNAGAILFAANSLDIRDASEITSNTQGGGDAGAVWVDIEDALVIGSGGKITARAARGVTDGSAGDIFITAGSLIMEDHDPNSIRQGAEIASTLEGGGQGGSITIDVANHAYIGQGTFISLASTFRAIDGDGGDLFMRAGSMTINGGSIRSITRSLGNAGTLLFDIAGDLILTGGGEITTSSLETYSGEAGRIGISAGNLYMDGGSTITSSTASGQSAGQIFIETAGDVMLTGAGTAIATTTTGIGRAGDVYVESLGGMVGLSQGAQITAATSAAGDAGSVTVLAPLIDLTGGSSITSSALEGSTGQSGVLFVGADTIRVLDRSSIATISYNENSAGEVFVGADTLIVNGPGSRITSENLSADGGAAGLVSLAARDITISNGGQVTTNSLAGPAGDILIDMPRDGVLRLLGDAFPGEITTSSGANTGGVITIATPFLILSDGGSILALGEQGGANVRIDTQVFINSADNLNLLSVDGQLDVNSGIEDVASGVLLQDLSFLDASKVLRQACSNNRDSGEVSELKIQSPGPQANTRQDPMTQGPNTEQLACR